MLDWTRQLERRIFSLLPAAWQVRLHTSHSSHKAVLRSMLWLGVFVLLAKGVAMFKEVAVAYRFGTSSVLEGFLLSFNLVTWPVSLSITVMHYVLVPILVRKQQTASDGGRAWQRQVTTWVWVIALLTGGVVAALLPSLISSGWLGLDAVGREAALATMPFMSLVTVLGMVAGWHACQLMSRQRHANTLLEATPSASILVAVLLVPGVAVDALLWGTGVGFALQVLLLLLIVRAANMPVAPSLSFYSPFDRMVLGNFSILLAAQAAMGLGGIIDQIVLAHMSAGALAAFGYANRVISLVLTLSAIVAGRALLPVLSGLHPEQSYKVARRWAWLLFWLGVIGAALIAVAAQPIIALLFERGAFSSDDTVASARILAWMALQLPLYLVGTVWVQWVLTRPRHAQVLWWAAVVGLFAKWGAMAFMIVVFDWQAEAVPVGLAAATAGYFWVLIRFVGRDLHEQQRRAS